MLELPKTVPGIAGFQLMGRWGYEHENNPTLFPGDSGANSPWWPITQVNRLRNGQPIQSIVTKIGCPSETLRRWIRASRTLDKNPGGTGANGLERIKALAWEVRELRQANEILRIRRPLMLLKEGSATRGAQAPVQAMKAFIDDYRCDHGVEPICKVLPIAPSTYYRHAARKANPALRSARAKRDGDLSSQVRRVWEENFQAYGACKVWRQLRREGQAAARCTVARLKGKLGLKGVVRAQRVKTTVSRPADVYPLDRVNRQFTADRPNALWVADFTYVSTWQGFITIAFVIDVFAQFIAGWKVSASARTEFVLDALKQAVYARRPVGSLIHHSDRGVHYVSIRYTERLAEAGMRRRWAASAIRMTMPWRKPSMAYIRRK